MASVLLIDDEPRILNGLRLLLKPHFNVITTTQPDEVFRVLKNEPVDVLISDQRMPQMEGVEVLRKAREISPGTVRVLLTGYADLSAVVGAVNEGEVYRYLQKPWDNQKLLEQVVDASRTSRQMREVGDGTTPQPAGEPRSVADRTRPAAGQALPVLAVFDRDPSTVRALDGLGDAGWLACERIHCQTLDDLLATLTRRDVGVLLADFSQADQNLERLLRMVKSQAPAVQTIISSRYFDVDAIMRLVNETRPFRFVSKPLDRHAHILSVYLAAAFQKYETVRQNTALTAFEKTTVDDATIERDRTLLGSLGAALKSALLGRFFRGGTRPAR